VLADAGGWLDAGSICAAFADRSDAAPQRDDAAAHGLVASRMHGQLVRLDVTTGQRVRKGELVLAIEAMKMEHRIEAPISGIVVEIGAAAGAQVAPGQLLLRIDAET
jgi:biotin carboxyl carrier protein